MAGWLITKTYEPCLDVSYYWEDDFTEDLKFLARLAGADISFHRKGFSVNWTRKSLNIADMLLCESEVKLASALRRFLPKDRSYFDKKKSSEVEFDYYREEENGNVEG